MNKMTKGIAALIAMAILIGCGGGGGMPIPEKKLSVKIELSGSFESFSPITAYAVVTKGDVKITKLTKLEWGDDFSHLGNVNPAIEYLDEGNYTISVAVTDDDGATASVSKTFVISDKVLTAIEKIFGPGAKTGDNFFMNASGEFEKTDQACQFDYIDTGSGNEIDARTIKISGIRWHTSFVEDAKEGKVIVVCDIDTYKVSDNFDDAIIAKYSGDMVTILQMSDHSDPDDPIWVVTSEEFNSSKINK